MRVIRKVIPWIGWMILGLAVIILWRAPDSAKKAYWWAVQETWDPATSLGLLNFEPANAPAFQAPEHYFPEDFLAGWYSGALEVFREPSLYAETGHVAVRLLVCRSFDDPVMVRLSYEDGKWMLISKRASGGAHIPPHIEFERSVPVPDSVANSLKASLDRIGFWSTPPNEKDSGLDGDNWVLEARFDDRYHIVDRWSPDDKNEFKKLCIWMLKKGRVAPGPLSDLLK